MAIKTVVLALAATLFFLACGSADGQGSYKLAYQTTTVFNTTDCTGGSIYASFTQVNYDADYYTCEYSQCLLNGIPGQSVRLDCTFNFVDTSYSLGAPASDQIALQTAKNFYLLYVQYLSLGSPSAPCSGLPIAGSLFPASSMTTFNPTLNLTLFGTCIDNSLIDTSTLYNCTKGFLTTYTFNGLGCKDVNLTNTESCISAANSAYMCATSAATFFGPALTLAMIALISLVVATVSTHM